MSYCFCDRITQLTHPTGVTPDIQTIGKGLNGGYQALSAVLISERVVDGLRAGSGSFANGQTFQCHPAAAAAGLAVQNIFESDNVIQNCAERGAQVSKVFCYYASKTDSVQLKSALERELGNHPNVGEIRGRGLFQSIEFVADRATKSTFPADVPLSNMLNDAIFDRGALVYSGFGKGTADGIVGDHILLSPPLNITSEQIDEMVIAVRDGVKDVFSRAEVVQAAALAKPWLPVETGNRT